MKRFFTYFIILLVLGAAGMGAYVYFKKSGIAEAFSVIPADAVFVIESTDMIEGWNKLSDSKMWKHLIASNTYYSEINEDALWLDSLIRDNSSLMSILNGRQILISGHLIPGNDYDFLFAINLGKASKISFLQDYIIEAAQLADFTTSKISMEGVGVHVLTDVKSNEPLYLAFLDNILVCSYNQGIIQASIQQSLSDQSIIDVPGFETVNSEISNRRLFNFYFNFSKAFDFSRVYTQDPGESVIMLANALLYSAFNINLESELLRFDGYTAVNDTTLSYLNALVAVSPGKHASYEVISDKAAVVISIGFSNYNDFYKKLEEEFARQDTGRYEDITKTRNRLEKYLKINLEEDFFGWIGSEIALVKLRPSSLTNEKDAVAFVHASDINLAHQGLDRMTSQIRKRSPLRFDQLEYQGYEINFLEIKGFFKVFFGKMFAGIDKPYFTYIGDYVVFSNSTAALMQIIDDYMRGNTLQRNATFTKFRDNFSNKANVSVYIQMPKLYSHVYYFSKDKKREAVKANKNLILSFSLVGFQMIADGQKFKTTFLAQHDEEAPFSDELERYESAADELYVLEYENLLFKIELPGEAAMSNSLTKLNYPDTAITWGEGMVSDGEPDGKWRIYYKSGNLRGIVSFSRGKADGQATFFHDNDNQVKRAEMSFEKDVLEGVYYEFFTTGTRKAMLPYRKGKADGKAEFYYESGMLRVAGEYKKGGKTGKWVHYTESGQVFDKERWKKDQRKR